MLHTILRGKLLVTWLGKGRKRRDWTSVVQNDKEQKNLQGASKVSGDEMDPTE